VLYIIYINDQSIIVKKFENIKQQETTWGQKYEQTSPYLVVF